MTGAEWPRPVPLVGDPTSAPQRAADPTGWAVDEEVRRGPGLGAALAGGLLLAGPALRRDTARVDS